MATVTPYNDLTGEKTISGTWTKISGNGPAAPGTYNGTLNFTGTTDGISIYDYTVTSGGCTHTSRLTYNSITPNVRTNDDCAGSFTLVTSSTITLYNDERCPGLAAPTDSGVGAASAWSSAEEDLWFKYYIPTSASPVDLEVIVDGSPYADGINQPMLAAYSGNCGALVEIDSGVGTSSQVSVNFTVSGASTPLYIYVRLASTAANAGQFDITINQM